VDNLGSLKEPKIIRGGSPNGDGHLTAIPPHLQSRTQRSRSLDPETLQKSGLRDFLIAKVL